jgi:hypothetical protein
MSARLSMIVSLAGLAGCGQVRLGGFPADGGTPMKPAAVQAWEPVPADRYTNVTTVFYGKKYMLVGFTDGEIYASPVSATPSWSRIDASTQPNIRTLPHRPVSAFLVDEEAGLSHLGVGYIGSPTHNIWVRLDETSDWYDTGSPDTAQDVLAFSRSPFDPRNVLAVTTWGVATSTDGGMSWGPYWPDASYPGSVSAITEGRSPGGLRRAWLGNAEGGVYYTDANNDGSWPASRTWTRMTGPAFPARFVSAISVNPIEPAEIWVSFKFLDGSGGGVWRSPDYGQSWENVHNPRLPDTSANVQNSGFGSVAIDPMLRIAYLTALTSATEQSGSVVGLWSIDSGQYWYYNFTLR